MRLILLAIFVLLNPITSLAEGFSSDHFEVSVGLEGISNISRRGAVLYDSYQLFPLLAVKLFHPSLQLIGSSLYYNYQFNDSLRIFSILNPQISNQPLYETGDVKADEEKVASEWDHLLEFKTESQLFSLLFSQGLNGHFGSHLELRHRFTFSTLLLDKFSVQTSTEAKLGWGSTLHNQFYYGKNIENSGPNFFSLGLVVTGEPKVDRLIPLLELHYNYVIGSNRQGNSVSKKPQSLYFLFILAKNLI